MTFYGIIPLHSFSLCISPYFIVMPQKNWQLYPFSTKIELENISLNCKQIAASNIKYSSLYQIDISTKLKSC